MYSCYGYFERAQASENRLRSEVLICNSLSTCHITAPNSEPHVLSGNLLLCDFKKPTNLTNSKQDEILYSKTTKQIVHKAVTYCIAHMLQGTLIYLMVKLRA